MTLLLYTMLCHMQVEGLPLSVTLYSQLTANISRGGGGGGKWDLGGI